MSFWRILYSLLLYFIFPFVIFRLFWRSLSNPAYRKRIGERLGFVNFEDNKHPIICLHAVSVGEAIAAKPLIEGLIEQYPNHKILVTTTTPTGSAQVKALFADRVAHVYFPYDLPNVVARFIHRVKPKMLIVIETEIWPNLFAACDNNNIPLLLVNARLSQRSMQRYLKVKSLVSETLSKVDFLAVRSRMDAERFKQLDARDNQIEVLGNIKFDFTIDKEKIEQGRSWRKSWKNSDQVWVAASTHVGEDEKILVIYQKLLKQFPTLLLVLVPRHPERFNDVFIRCNELKSKGIQTIRHSVRGVGKGIYDGVQANIILGDTMGDMQSWFATADVVFIGGSLVEIGGHNPIEPIAQGVSVVSGPYMFNFDDITEQLSNKLFFYQCENIGEVGDTISKLLFIQQSEQAKAGQREKAEDFMLKQRGITARILKSMVTFYKPSP